MLKKVAIRSLFLLIVVLTPALCLAESASDSVAGSVPEFVPEPVAKVKGGFGFRVESRLVGSSSSYEYENVCNGEVSKANYSSVDMLNKAVVGGKMVVKKGDWKASAKVEVGINADSEIYTREKTITLKYDRYFMTYGTHYHWGVTVGNKYLTDEIGDIMYAGENVHKRDDYLEVGFDFGEERNTTLKLIVGENIRSKSSLADGDKYKETVLGTIISTSMGDFTLKASYTRVNTAVDSGLEDSASKDSIVNGKAQTSAALGMGYKITDKVAVSLNADIIRKKDGGQYSYNHIINGERGDIAADVINEQVLVFILDVDVDDDSGFSVAYNFRSEELSDGKDSPMTEDRFLAGYRTNLANINFHAQYYYSRKRDNDADAHNTKKYLDRTDSKLGVGMGYRF